MALIVIRLHPAEPVTGAVFRAYLDGLVVEAFDVPVDDTVPLDPQTGGVRLGEARYRRRANPPASDPFRPHPRTTIVQHWGLPEDPPPPGTVPRREWKAVATALIEVPDAPPGEFGTPDLRLRITRGGVPLVHRREYTNVPLAQGGLPPRAGFPGVRVTSLYLALPAVGSGADAPGVVHLPEDGTPPAFAAVVRAAELVLAADPGGLPLERITLRQARRIAREIAWNQALRPLPRPIERTLDQLYTPPDEPQDEDDPTGGDEVMRAKFEGDLQSHYTRGEADAERLAPYVYAAAASLVAARRSREAATAGLVLPVLLAAGARTTRVVLDLDPAAAVFALPPEVFYALAASLPASISGGQRFDLAVREDESALRTTLTAAVETGVVALPAGVTVVGSVRRLRALGLTSLPAPRHPWAGGEPRHAQVRALVGAWLAHPDADEGPFWTGVGTAAGAAGDDLRAGHLEVVLRALTRDDETRHGLTDAVRAELGLPREAAGLAGWPESRWAALFEADPGLLPEFTRPGGTAARIAAFVRHVRGFFAVGTSVGLPQTAPPVGPATFPLPGDDPLTRFAAAFPTRLGTEWDGLEDVVRGEVATVLPGDEPAQEWLWDTLSALNELVLLTAAGWTAPARYSLVEALHARGFRSRREIAALSAEAFARAVVGGVAYPHAAALHARAVAQVGARPGPEEPGEAGFSPINPGCLTDCVPAPHRSPLGPVAYLHELLRLSARSTCDDPFPAGDDDGAGTLGALLRPRRGPLGELAASPANLATPVPVVDLVVERLAAAAADPDPATWPVRDTAADRLGGHLLRSGEGPHDPGAHDPEALFGALPEHVDPAAFARLRTSFRAPILPYDQPLDALRAHLAHLGTSRYALLRRFRAAIHEPALAPADPPPADFGSQLWRYPVRVELAVEYLGSTTAEHARLFDGPVADPFELYGFTDPAGWTDVATHVPQLLRRLGLSWCELVELGRDGPVPFGPAADHPDLPECAPCELDPFRIAFADDREPADGLTRLAVVVRLWRLLARLPGARYGVAAVRDLVTTFGLFRADGGTDPDFVRSLAAFQILRDDLRLPLGDATDPTRLLALWRPAADPTKDPAARGWAVDALVEGVLGAARRGPAPHRGPERRAILRDNLDALSLLAGLDPDPGSPDRWDARPPQTLRFAEVLVKLAGSALSPGELHAVVTADPHLVGDDPFPLPPDNESAEDPLTLPDDTPEHDLWALRAALRTCAPDPADVEALTWADVETVLRERFGHRAPETGLDPLRVLADHVFPSALDGTVPPEARRYARALPGSPARMWNTSPGPFRYDPTTAELTVALPVADADVLATLARLRPLTGAERAAVRELYFAPQADLAPFGYLFDSPEEARARLVEEPDEQRRWAWFRFAVARAVRRGTMVAEHLAAHVGGADPELAWTLLRRCGADENLALGPWEDDLGAAPARTWGPATGGAFAALFGLLGTGLLTELAPDGKAPVWRDVGGDLAGFGAVRDAANAPLPTVLPAPDLALTASQLAVAQPRNGFAQAVADGAALGGAQGHTVRAEGYLLVEEPGEYRFAADAAPGSRWRVALARGTRSWVLLERGVDGSDLAGDAVLRLRRGTYRLVVESTHPAPSFADPDALCPARGGLRVDYAGPDTGDALVPVPRTHLFRGRKDRPLADGLPVDGTPGRVLAERYPSTLRDIRRTYQRAFRALLLAHRLGLAVDPVADDGGREIDYLLDHPDLFAGRSHLRAVDGTLATHRAHLDPNLLPVRDGYAPPSEDREAGAPVPAAPDARSAPSRARRAALVDAWERLHDYATVRAAAAGAPEPPLWLLFHESAEGHPDPGTHLHRHLGVDLAHESALRELDGHRVEEEDLRDDRWAVRLAHAERWLDALRAAFPVRDERDARPGLWAAADPAPGAADLAAFVRVGLLENEPRPVGDRYADVRGLHDGLRLRGRAALVAYLCAERGLDATGLAALLLVDLDAGLCARTTRIEDAITAVQAFVNRARLGLEPTLVVGPELERLWDSRFADLRRWLRRARRDAYPEDVVEWEETERARRTEGFRFLESELRRGVLTLAVPGGPEYWRAADPTPTPLQVDRPSGLRRVPPAAHGFDLRGRPEWAARPSWLAVLGLPTAPGSPPDPVPVEGGTTGGSTGGTSGSGTLDGPTELFDVPPVGHPELGLLGLGHPELGPDGGGGAHVVAVAGGPAVSAVFAVSAGSGVRPDVDPHVRPDQPADGRGDGRADGRGDGVRGTDPAAEPWWVEAAVRVGIRFVRVAASGSAPAAARPRPLDGCCAECGRAHPPGPDEYYFWLVDAARYEAVLQIADDGVGVAAEGEPRAWSWHDDEFLPGLLTWPAGDGVHLAWSRVHGGRFEPVRRSTEALPVGVGEADLVLEGRREDSLWFSVPRGRPRPGHAPAPAPGFRYDLVPDTAVVLPEVADPGEPPALAHPGGLAGFPHFALHAAGAPVLPATPYAPALAVAGALRAQGRFPAALRWYAAAHDTVTAANSWCDDGAREPGDRARRRSVQLHHLRTLLEWAGALARRGEPEDAAHARVLLESAVRVLGAPPRRVAGSAAVPEGAAGTVGGFVPAAAPLHPAVAELHGQVADRLALVRACLDGQRIRPPAGWHRAGGSCADELDPWAVDSPYRFTVLLDRARALAARTAEQGAELLAACERGDAEHLAALHAGAESRMAELGIDLRRHQWREADWQVQALERTKEIGQTRLRHTTGLIEEGLVGEEEQYAFLTYAALGLRAAAGISEGISQAVGVVPDIFTGVAGFGGTPLFYSQMPVGSKLAGVLATAARIATQIAEGSTTTAGLRLTEAGFARRDEDWRHQRELLDLEILQVERQLLAAERRRDVALRELEVQQRQREHTAEVRDLLRDRFTAPQLHLHLQRETAALHAQAYELALRAARQAERAFRLERGERDRAFVEGEHWDTLTDGLLAGQRLGQALSRMEQAYLDAHQREHEHELVLSLRDHFPAEFLALQATGCCDLDVEEFRFDQAHPGQWMRRIRAVDLTVSCVTGRYTGVHATLALLRSEVRAEPTLAPDPDGCCPPGDDPGYAARPEDPRFVVRYGGREVLATSHGRQDADAFELSFADPRYLRFEYHGAVSRWRLRLPPEQNRFDPADLDDVVLRMRYSARDGGADLVAAAAAAARDRLPDRGMRHVDVRRELPEGWALFEPPGGGPRELPLRLHRALVPYVPGAPPLSVRRVSLVLETGTAAAPNTHHTVEFRSGGCGPDRVRCVATADLPGMLHGVLTLPEPVPLGPEPVEAGVLRLPDSLPALTRAQLVLHYGRDDRPGLSRPGR